MKFPFGCKLSAQNMTFSLNFLLTLPWRVTYKRGRTQWNRGEDWGSCAYLSRKDTRQPLYNKKIPASRHAFRFQV